METLSIQAGFALLAERPIEKTGTILMWVQVPGAARDFCPKVNFQCRLSFSGTSPARTLAAMPLFGHTKIPHTLIGMGSTALVAAVPYPGKVIRIFHTGQRTN